jgi:hypothetical protein
VEDIQQQLRRVPDACHRARRVLPARQREVGHRVQLEQERAGDLEEIRQQLVRGPLHHQRREIVEDVEHLEPLLGDDPVDLAAERIEPRAWVHLDQLDARVGRQHGRMRGEAQIDQLSARLQRTRRERPDKVDVVLQLIHLPDHVVAQPQPLDHLVERLQPAGDDRFRFEDLFFHAHRPRRMPQL